MSTVNIIKDHPRGKKGDTISVPFGVGRELIAGGFAAYPASAAPAPAAAPAVVPTPAADRHAAEFDRLNETHKRALGDVRAEHESAVQKLQKDHAAELAKVRADLDVAHKQITELQAQLKRQGGK